MCRGRRSGVGEGKNSRKEQSRMREHWVKFGGKKAQPLEKVVSNGAHASAVFSLPELPLLRGKDSLA